MSSATTKSTKGFMVVELADLVPPKNAEDFDSRVMDLWNRFYTPGEIARILNSTVGDVQAAKNRNRRKMVTA